MRTILLFILMLLTAADVLAFEVGESGYSRVNIWYENPDNIPATNYHRGDILPVGTRFTLLRKTRDFLIMKDDYGAEYKIVHNRGYMQVSINQLIDRLLAHDKAQVDLARFTESEQAAIRSGELVEGMSREAVIAAFGYPPTHKTPSLDKPVWQYWIGKVDQRLVYFQKGKLSKVEKYYPGSFLLGKD